MMLATNICTLEVLQRLLAHISRDLPSGKDVPLVEYIFHLFKCTTRSLGEHEEDVNKRGKIEA